MANKDKKKKSKVASDDFKNITDRTALGKLQQYVGANPEWMNLKSTAFNDSIQSVFPDQFHLPMRYDDTTGRYQQNFAKWNKVQPVLNPQTGKTNEIPEMGLGGFIGGALGSLIPIPGVGTALGTALGEGAEGLIRNRKQNKLLEQQQVNQNQLQVQQPVSAQNYQTSNTFASNYAPTFAQGGTIGGDLVELEKEEVTFGPDGDVKKHDLPDHAYATPNNIKSLDMGTKVYSDRLKTSTGVTFAEAADVIRKKIDKINKTLYA